MRSLPPADYARLPKLAPPAGYICVIRDVDSNSFRIDGADLPAAFVEQVLAVAAGDFGIELLSILETEDLAASAAELYEAHHAELSGEWLELDAYQLQELRWSILRIDDYASHYLAAQRVSSSGPPAKDRPPDEAAASSSRWRFGAYSRPSRRMRPGPTAYKHYGLRALNRHRRREMERPAANEQVSWRQSLSDKFDDFFHNHPGLIIAFLLLVLLFSLIQIWQYPYRYPY